MAKDDFEQKVEIPVDSITLEGELALLRGSQAVVIFAHGSGSSRHSKRNKFVAQALRESGIGTLLFDLLTTEEDAVYENRFNINLLTERLKAATKWLKGKPESEKLKIGYFGASTGAAAALRSAADLGWKINAVVSRGGRPDLARGSLSRVQAPTLLIIGGFDDIVIQLNQEAYKLLRCEKELKIIPGATHLFEEPGKLEDVARLAAGWFARHLLDRKAK